MSLIVQSLKRMYKWLFRHAHQLLRLLGRVYPEGFCNVCGRRTFFIRQRARDPKDTDLCAQCGAMARYRLLGAAIASLLDGEEGINWSASTAKMSSHPGVVVLDTSYRSVLSGYLTAKIELLMSEYLASKALTSIFHDLMSIDLKSIPLQDGSLDMVITSDVFEHIDKPWEAFQEISRVLRRGGYHIFTVPLSETEPTTERAKVRENGSVDFVLPPVYHGDPLSLRGSLVFTDFGNDLTALLDGYGFETQLYVVNDDVRGFHGTKMLVSRKTG